MSYVFHDKKNKRHRFYFMVNSKRKHLFDMPDAITKGTYRDFEALCEDLEQSNEAGTNILGIAQSTVADGQSVTISMAGSSYTTSGLTAGELYYAASNGDPSTTAGRSGTMGSPFAIAKSTTELLIMRQVFGDTA